MGQIIHEFSGALRSGTDFELDFYTSVGMRNEAYKFFVCLSVCALYLLDGSLLKASRGVK